MAGDRLSDLPDDLLRRILHFAPAKEGASTAVLSRRWRTLWRTSGAVNLDTRSYTADADRAIRKRFFRGADAALAAAAGPVRRLSIHVQALYRHHVRKFLTRRRISAVLSNPACRRVEELRVGAMETYVSSCENKRSAPSAGDFYKLSFGALPRKALRVLHIINCPQLKPPPSRTVFRRLEALRLEGCVVSLVCLQRVVDAAPRLATLHLESFSFPKEGAFDGTKDGSVIGLSSCYQLICPVVTTLVLEDISWPPMAGGLELDVPRLRYFMYKGIAQLCHQLSLKSHVSPDIVGVDLHLIDGEHPYSKHQMCISFWRFIRNFNGTRFLRLKLDFAIDHIAVTDKKGQDELEDKKLFHNLERFQLEGRYTPARETAAVAIANFLHCCPVVRDLCLKLSQVPISLYSRSGAKVAQLDFDKSVEHFSRRRRSTISLDGDNDYDNCDVSDIPCLSKHSFDCLKSYLRRVSLKIWMERPNCFGAQLAKFFAEKVMVLEELSIDDGSQKLSEHMNGRVGRWIFNSSKRKNSLTVIGFGESCPRKRQRR